ncbi:MAG: ABC transporter ATP-binding protein, partial [Anaerolineae bacterium]|nr:ABC transporter ATP-binding protein [Anaerolineae bacterium]
MSAETIIQVKNLGKRFKIYPRKLYRILEWLTLGKKHFHSSFWAVKDVSFEVKRGEALGIIGPNGAGKTTLLKVLTGILAPSSGIFQIDGRVLSLFELSSGLDLELTGRENIIRSAQLLGFPEDYVHSRMEHIQEFSELGDFFDRPIRTYSTGMRTRLSFSMFAFLDCDVLILDEVLAVGDVFFRQKCYARMEELTAQDTAIILVTHNFTAMTRYCDRAITLHQGSIIFQGDPASAVTAFMKIQGDRPAGLQPEVLPDGDSEPLSSVAAASSSPGDFNWPAPQEFQNALLVQNRQTQHVKMTALSICDQAGAFSQSFTQGETATLYLEFAIKQPLPMPVLNVEITDEYNLLIHSKNSIQHGLDIPASLNAGDTLRFSLSIALNLAPSHYILNLDLFSLSPARYHKLDGISPVDLTANMA